MTGDTEDASTHQYPTGSTLSPRAMGNSDQDLDLAMSNNVGYTLGRGDEMSSLSGLDYMTDLFGTKEAQDFSMFQLQPDLFSGNAFGGGLDQYYNSVMPRGEGSNDLFFR